LYLLLACGSADDEAPNFDLFCSLNETQPAVDRLLLDVIKDRHGHDLSAFFNRSLYGHASRVVFNWLATVFDQAATIAIVGDDGNGGEPVEPVEDTASQAVDHTSEAATISRVEGEGNGGEPVVLVRGVGAASAAAVDDTASAEKDEMDVDGVGSPALLLDAEASELAAAADGVAAALAPMASLGVDANGDVELISDELLPDAAEVVSLVGSEVWLDVALRISAQEAAARGEEVEVGDVGHSNNLEDAQLDEDTASQVASDVYPEDSVSQIGVVWPGAILVHIPEEEAALSIVTEVF